MPKPKRNYKNESLWKRLKYHRFEADLPIEYKPVMKFIKDKFGNAKWLIKAVGIWQKRPELWEDEKDGSNKNHL
jgi:hypothetical protein